MIELCCIAPVDSSLYMGGYHGDWTIVCCRVGGAKVQLADMVCLSIMVSQSCLGY